MQGSGVLDDLGLLMGVLVVMLIVLIVVYVRLNVRIFAPGTHYRHYRKGRVILEGNNGGMVVKIPFLDHIEVVGLDTTMIDPLERSIVKERLVRADVHDVWTAWTTEEGVKTFFAPDAKVELRINGPYEMYFDPSAIIGQRGGEGVRILSYLPKEMLSFEWNAPPQFQAVRNIKTWVVVQFESNSPNETSVRLTHCGWRDSSPWDEVYRYFDRAWDIVMDRLQKRFDEGPIEWSSV